MKTVTWQLTGPQDLPDEVLATSSSSVLSDHSLQSLSRALDTAGLPTCMCLGLPTTTVISTQLANAHRPPAAITLALLLHWRGLKRTAAKERDLVRALDQALRCAGRAHFADVIIDRYAENQALNDACWKKPLQESKDF